MKFRNLTKTRPPFLRKENVSELEKQTNIYIYIMEKQREIERGPHMAFTDLEEEYDKVPREVMLWALEEK